MHAVPTGMGVVVAQLALGVLDEVSTALVGIEVSTALVNAPPWLWRWSKCVRPAASSLDPPQCRVCAARPLGDAWRSWVAVVLARWHSKVRPLKCVETPVEARLHLKLVVTSY